MTERSPTAYRVPLSQVTSFKYLGQFYCSRGRRLAGSDAQLLLRQAEVVAANSDADQGGRRFQDIGTDIFGSGAIGPAIRVRDMSPDTAYAEGVGRIPP